MDKKLEELAPVFLAHMLEVIAAQGTPEEAYNLPRQYEWLKFVTENYPDAVITYLSKEPEHFAGLAQQGTNEGMAIYTRQVADKIYHYSIAYKVGMNILHKGEEAGLKI